MKAPYRWVGASKTWFQCVSDGVTSFLHWPIDMASWTLVIIGSCNGYSALSHCQTNAKLLSKDPEEYFAQAWLLNQDCSNSMDLWWQRAIVCWFHISETRKTPPQPITAMNSEILPAGFSLFLWFDTGKFYWYSWELRLIWVWVDKSQSQQSKAQQNRGHILWQIQLTHA